MKQVVFIPGLGDPGTISLVRRLIKPWQKHGVNVHFFDAKWQKRETYEEKLQRTLAWVDNLSFEKNDRVYLVAISAGGSLAAKVYKERSNRFDDVRLVASKLKGSKEIGKTYQKIAPALKPAVEISEKVFDQMTEFEKSLITTYQPIIDFLVPTKDMVMDGITNKKIPMIGHSLGIGYALKFTAKPN